MNKVTSTRSVSTERLEAVRQEISAAPAAITNGFQAHVARHCSTSRQMVYMVLRGKSESRSVAVAICKLWTKWKGARLAA
jgi:hypothetical protein